jgi:hypothetical protein
VTLRQTGRSDLSLRPRLEERESALGPADPLDLAVAAEKLRDRTMSLEEVRTMPSAWFVVFLLVTLFIAAALLVVFRSDLRLFAKWLLA